MDPLLQEQIYAVEESHWWYRGRRRLVAELIRGLELRASPQILDAGCGSGRNMIDLARWGTVTGIDLAEESVARARLRGAGLVVQGSLTDLPFPAEQFDLIVCLDVIEHIDDDLEALRQLRNVLRPGGTLLVAVPAYQSLWSSHDAINGHKRRYTRQTFQAVAGQAGWKPVWDTYFNGTLLPLAAISRRLTRSRNQLSSPISDLQRTPPCLNRALEWPLRIEVRLIGRRRRVPAGLSFISILSA